MNDIIGFWHIGRVNDWALIIPEQYKKLKDSGLYDASKKIIVGFVGGEEHLDELTVPILHDPKFEVFTTNNREDFEYPTLARAWKEATESKEPFLAYYFHTKGASSAACSTNSAANYWRKYMEYFIIERWQKCTDMLQMNDVCGVEWELNNHFSGNFWWATSEYLRKLPNGYEFWEAYKTNRGPAEFYIGISRPKVHCFNDFTENLYSYKIPPERYRDDLK